MTNKAKRNLGVAIGSVQNLVHEGRRKSENAYLWEHLGLHQKVNEYDTLLTGEKSRMQLKFDNGESMDLGPETMVELGGSAASTQIHLKAGDLAISSNNNGNPFKVTMENGAEIDLRDSKAIVRMSKGEADISILQGTAALHRQNTNLVELKRNDFIRLNREGKMKRFAQDIQLVSPADGMVITYPERRIQFIWKVERPEQNCVLYVRSDQGLLHKSVLKRDGANSMELPDGTYYWKIECEQSISPENKLTISRNVDKLNRIRFSKIQVRGPNSKLYIDPDSMTANIQVSWVPFSTNSMYLLRVNKGKEAGTPFLLKKNLRSSSIMISLPPGNFSYQVEAFDRKGGAATGKSKIHNILVVRKSLPKPPTVRSISVE